MHTILIKKAKNNIIKAKQVATSNHLLNKNPAFEWIGDNAYVFLGATKGIVSGIKNTPKEIQKNCTEIYNKFFLEFEKNTIKINRDYMLSFLEYINEQYPHFSYNDVSCLKFYLCAAIYISCGNICNKLLKSVDFDAQNSIKNCLLSLKYLLSTDFDEFARLSPLERLLCTDTIYANMTKESKAYYRYRLEKLAKKKRVSKLTLAKQLLVKAGRDGHIGDFLLNRCKFPGVLYFALMFSLTGLITLTLAVTLSPVFILALFPVWETVKQLLDRIFSLCIKSTVLPSLEIKDIPDGSGVMVAVAVLLTGTKQDAKIFSRLESMYHAVSGKNIYFGVLCDLADKSVQFDDKDKSILENANAQIFKLRKKYGDVFFLFTRKRQFDASEQKYMVYERKRGAVVNLCALLAHKTDNFDEYSIKPSRKVCENIKYCITLDSDTNLPIDAVHKMVGTMLHPNNTPLVKNGRVVDGFACLSPSVSTTLSSAAKTSFSFIMSGSVGSDLYSGARFDLYQTLFGNGIFCGKGIFDKNVFLELNSKATLPDGIILSHDAIEGAHLNCNMLTNLVLTDTYPKNQLSYFKRLHRWIRGDIQNMIFLLKNVKVGDKRVKNNISVLSKYKLFDNVRRHLTPVFSLVCLAVAIFLPARLSTLLTLTAVIYLAVELVLDIIFSLGKSFRSATRKFFSKGVRTALNLSFSRFLISFCMAIKSAFVSIDAIARSIYRMTVSKKKLLEWTTASQSDFESSDGFLGFVSKNLSSITFGFVLFVFSPSKLLKVCAVIWFFAPLIFYLTSKPYEKTRHISGRHKNKLIRYSAKMWKFYEQNVTTFDNCLVPDNIQFFPEKRVCHRTSPTNIGLYFVSIVCANVFSFITKYDLKTKLRASLDTVEKLKKYKGNLYNWYDTITLEVLSPKFISSVDSGNFVACLICAKQMLKKIQEDGEFDKEISRLEKLISDTDLSCLYNKSAGLFSLGLDVTENGAIMSENCYDLYMSEARTLSYIAVSTRKVEPEHWAKLSRRYIGKNDRIGLASWTGTSFEYFMPALFLSVPEGSVSYEALKFALMCQKMRCGKLKNKKVWGISESAYFDFDPYLNYKYKAHGIPMLGLKRGLDRNLVVSPYSSFLALEFDTSAVMENLSAFEKLDMYDKYGFYEALDFTPDVQNKKACVIQSYMAHHVGMSFVACANACFDEIVRKSFMNDAKMQCGAELLYEKVDADAVLTKLRHESVLFDRPQRVPEEKCRIKFEFCGFENRVCTILSDGKTSAVVADNGYMQISSGDVCINRAVAKDYDLTSSLFVFAKIDGVVYSASPLPLYRENVKYSFEKQSGLVKFIAGIYEKNVKKCTFEAHITIDKKTNHALKIQTLVKGLPLEKQKDVKFAVCFEPQLLPDREYNSHKTFCDLFVSCKQVPSGIMFSRRSRETGKDFSHLLVSTTDKDCDFIVFKDKVFDLPLCMQDYSKIFDVSKNSCVGALINPFCLVRYKPCDYSKGRVKAQASLIFSKDKYVIEDINSVFDVSFGNAKDKLCILENNLRISCALSQEIKENEKLCPYMHLLTSCVFKNVSDKPVPFENFGMDKIWFHSISGDLPIVTIVIDSVFTCSFLRDYIRAFLFLSRMGFNFDLVVLCNDSDKYTNPCFVQVMQTIEGCKARDYITKTGGGIFVINRDDTDDDAQRILAISSLVIDFEGQKSTDTFEQNTKIIRKVHFESTAYPDNAFVCGPGYFDKGDLSYTLDKSKKIETVMSHVLASEKISTVLTHQSLGYTFDTNASLKRITPFFNDVFEANVAEGVYLCDGDNMYDLISCAQFVTYHFGFAKYKGSINKKPYEVVVFVPQDTPLKIVKVTAPSGFGVRFCVLPLMGSSLSELGRIQTSIGGGFVRFYNPFSQYFEKFGFVGGYSDTCQANCKVYSTGTFKGYVGAEFEKSEQDGQYTFCIGTAKNEQEFENSVSYFFKKDNKALESSLEFAQSLLAPISVSFEKMDDVNMSVKCMFDKWLCYQNGASRFFASSGFYQSGGASGFRDKLQDCLTLMYSRPDDVRKHIIQSCKAQFEQGDVLHWWHDIDGKIMGVRTQISDDTLFLPYVVSQYIDFTDDMSLLDEDCPFAVSEELKENESERYITVQHSKQSQSVYKHCLKSIFRVLNRVGKDGLCLIGTGDWCDGLNRVGKDEKGQSVWLSMFLVLVLEKFSKVCLMYEDDRMAVTLENKAGELRQIIQQFCFDKQNGYFYRAFADNGSVIGGPNCQECRIDSLPQSFSAICSIGTKEQIYSALTNSYDKLFDKEYKIYKLFSPPFQYTPADVGYIKGYVSGIRENGGQYTHAAVWACIGLFEGAKLFDKGCAKQEKLLQKAKEVLFWLITPYRMTDEKLMTCYRCEPYVVCADIYSNELWQGRGGWSWYTGAAGWLYRLLVEKAFCFSLHRLYSKDAYIEFDKSALYVPCMLFGEFTLDMHFESIGAHYTIRFCKGDKQGVFVDGKESGNKVHLESGNHTVTVVNG